MIFEGAHKGAPTKRKKPEPSRIPAFLLNIKHVFSIKETEGPL